MGDTPAMEERRRKLEEKTICGCFGTEYVPPKWWQLIRRFREWRWRRHLARFKDFKFPSVKRPFPSLVAKDLVDVQPMDKVPEGSHPIFEKVFKRRIGEKFKPFKENVGTFDRFAFPKLVQAVRFGEVKDAPNTVHVTFAPWAIGAAFEGRTAGDLRETLNVPKHIPDHAVMTREGRFTWEKSVVDFNLPPKEETK